MSPSFAGTGRGTHAGSGCGPWSDQLLASSLIAGSHTTARKWYQAPDAGPLSPIALATLTAPARPSFLAGQVRFQWPAAVLLNFRRKDGLAMPEIRLDCQDSESVLGIALTITSKTAGPAAEQLAADMARGLVSDIARFRLTARKGQLGTERVRQLTAQRDNPTPVDSGKALRWALDGGLRVGQPPDCAAYRKRTESRYDEAVSAMKRHERKGSRKDLKAALSAARDLLDNAVVGSAEQLGILNLYAGVLMARYESAGDLTDLATVIDIMRGVAERTAGDAPEWLPGALSNLGSALTKRWQSALNERDITEAIAAHEQAVTLFTPEIPASWAMHASNLGLALRARYPLTSDVADLDRAVGLCQQVLDSLPRGRPGGPTISPTWATHCRHRWRPRMPRCRRPGC